ncbi:MAG: hypothetical protein PHD51_00180 [Patescibacteria group bacterium]|nr:hypothetical protein [Patescibacteria group bacterium]MDD5490714.1 hypothetical protein [Patescibacteria group bacterium]
MKEIESNNSREIAEKYLARTDIKHTEQAREYLNRLKVLFWIAFVGSIVLRGLSESESELVVIFFILYIGFLVYFIYFCTKVLKAEKLSKANALWCMVFAPLSWLWFYPLITDPLKIILGEKQPPIRLSDAERKQRATETNKKILRLWISAGVVVLIFVVILAIILH